MGGAIKKTHTVWQKHNPVTSPTESVVMSNVLQGNHPAVQDTWIRKLAKEILDGQVE
jgi:hypothetical protein